MMNLINASCRLFNNNNNISKVVPDNLFYVLCGGFPLKAADLMKYVMIYLSLFLGNRNKGFQQKIAIINWSHSSRLAINV